MLFAVCLAFALVYVRLTIHKRVSVGRALFQDGRSHRSWGLTQMSPVSLEAIAVKINAAVRGWIDYLTVVHPSNQN